MVGYKNTGNIDKGFALYKKIKAQDEIEPDELFQSVFMKICAKVHHAELATKIFRELSETRDNMTCLPINAYIKALASRKDVKNSIFKRKIKLKNSMQKKQLKYTTIPSKKVQSQTQTLT